MNITRLIMCMLLLVLSLQSAVAQEISNNNKIINSSAKTAKTDQAVKNKQPMAVKWSQADQIPGLIAAGKMNAQQIPNPHWQADACLACHLSNARRASKKNLRKSSIEAICINCHDAHFDHSYIHPVNVKPDKKMLQHIKPEFRKTLLSSEGKVSCSSCHDLTIQCLAERRKEAKYNHSFFRVGSYEKRTELCYYCHDETDYKRINAHDQIDDKGQLNENTCSICHADSYDELQKASTINELSFHAQGELSSMCWGCHNWTPHPGGQFMFYFGKPKSASDGSNKIGSDKPEPAKTGPDHLVAPSERVMQKMEKSSAKYDIAFPLEPGSGKVFCGTCHNAHEKGVIKNKATARGADAEKRLRAKKICQYCHDI